ncbi:MAG: hypothetical protein J6C65_00445 [Prevotella sp.]|nr:hypothetical protein [Prevotella sp.]
MSIILSVSILVSCAGMAQEAATKRIQIIGTDDSQPATVCVSVTGYVDKEHSGNIIEGLLLRSDIRGRIETPEAYFDGSAKSKVAMDVLMLTQGWSRYSAGLYLKGLTVWSYLKLLFPTALHSGS